MLDTPLSSGHADLVQGSRTELAGRAGIVEIFTDGACSPNPGPGGWGAVLQYGRHRREIHGGEPATTNNRMEIMAAIRALESLTRPSTVHVHTDSEYLRKGITEWLPRWDNNGWKTKQNKPVKNADLWQRLDSVARGHEVQWFWVKGHAGHPGNERADELACLGGQEAAADAVDSERGPGASGLLSHGLRPTPTWHQNLAGSSGTPAGESGRHSGT
jgi:ribonuclease HI